MQKQIFQMLRLFDFSAVSTTFSTSVNSTQDIKSYETLFDKCLSHINVIKCHALLPEWTIVHMRQTTPENYSTFISSSFIVGEISLPEGFFTVIWSTQDALTRAKPNMTWGGEKYIWVTRNKMWLIGQSLSMCVLQWS